MTTDRRGGYVRVSFEILADMLRMPPGTVIRGVVQEPEDVMSGAVKLVVEHPDLYSVQEGARFPEVVYELTDDGKPGQWVVDE